MKALPIGLGCFLLAGACASTPAMRPTATPPAPVVAAWRALLDGTGDRGAAVFATERSALGSVGAALAAEERGDVAGAIEAWLQTLDRSCAGRDECSGLDRAAFSIALSQLSLADDDLAGRQDVLTRVHAAEKKALPLPLASGLHMLLGTLEARAGHREAADRDLLAAGCGGLWYVAGPFGELPLVDLDRPFARPEQRPRKEPGCRVLLDGPRGRSGVVYAGRTVEVKSAATFQLELEDAGALRLFIDGKLALALDDRDRRAPGDRALVFKLPAGRHDLLLKLGAPEGRIEIGATLVADQPFTIIEAPPSAAAESPTAGPVAARVEEEPIIAIAAKAAAQTDRSDGARIDLLLGTLAAIDERDGDRAEELGLALGRVAPKSAAAALLAGYAYIIEDSRPTRFANDLARRAFLRALELRPTFWRARAELAELDLVEDRARVALRRLDDAPTPTTWWRIESLRYRAWKTRGLSEEADPHLVAARRAAPLACAPLAAAVAQFRERKQREQLKAAAELHARCSDGQDGPGDVALDEGDYPTAIAHFERVLGRNPNRQGTRLSMARALRSSGNITAAVPHFQRLVDTAPRVPSYRIELADALWRQGEKDRAQKVLEAGLAELPENEELQRAITVLDGRGRTQRWLQPFRLDGMQILETYKKTAARPTAPAVIVLDRTVTYVFPTGAQLTLTHNIIHVLSKQGMQKFAEVEIPDGAELLKLRVIKADGTTHDGETIAGKGTPSLPELDVGDYIEFEHVDAQSPPAAFPGGFLGQRFYFRSFDAPLDRSEYVVVTPATMELQIDERANPPAMKTETRDGLTIRTWAAHACPQVAAEPEAVPHAEYLPSVRVASALSLERWRRFLYNSQLAALRPNAPMRALVAQLQKGLTTPRDRIAALDHWVRENIQGGGSIDEPATFVLERRQGSRAMLLLALLRAADISAEMVLARPLNAAMLDSAMPDLEAFNEPLLRVSGAGFVDPRYRHGPPGVLGPRLRGADALVIGQGGAADAMMAKLPVENHDQRRMKVDVELAADLGAKVKISETLEGIPALEWREAIENLPPTRIRPEFEQQTLGQQFPGASLVSLSWQGEKEDEKPLTVTYEFTLPQVGRAVADAVLIAAPYPARLLNRYGQRARRETTLVTSFVAPTEIVTTFGGALVPSGVPDTTLSTKFGDFALESKKVDGLLRVVTRFVMPLQRIAPADYAAFLQFAAGVDRAEIAAAFLPKK